MLNKISILGVTITSESKRKVLKYLFDRLKNPNNKTFLITPNPEMLVYASKHLGYKDKLNRADISLPDGIGLFFASGLLGKQLQGRVTGVDFIEELCQEAREKPLSMGFLGGESGIAKRAAECLKKKYPWIDVAFAAGEWPETQRLKIKDLALKKKNPQSIDILFVAYGVPKQEEWIYEHLDGIPVKAAMGVGGAFDFLSGSVSRAPFIIRLVGFEWLYRLIMQPWRWKRQLALIEFISLVFKESFSNPH